jgi:hypothetical protein
MPARRDQGAGMLCFSLRPYNAGKMIRGSADYPFNPIIVFTGMMPPVGGAFSSDDKALLIVARPGDVMPETLDIIKVPDGLKKDVNDHTTVIHEDPSSFHRPLDADGAYVLGRQCLLDVLSRPDRVQVGGPGHDDDKVSKAREIPDIKDDEIPDLSVQSCPNEGIRTRCGYIFQR